MSMDLKQRLFPHNSRRRMAGKFLSQTLKRRPNARELISPTNRFLSRQFRGQRLTCNVCGENAGLIYEPQIESLRREHMVSLLRETLRCGHCQSWQRIRALAHAVIDECNSKLGLQEQSIRALAGKIDQLDVLDTDTVSRIGRILKGKPSYKVSDFRPDLPFGKMANGAYNIDLQKIAFDDASFDIILSTDVLEHVRDPKAAHQEIFRCLKPGGVHIFTVPFDLAAASTKVLVDTSSDQDIYLQLPQIHGDAISGGIVAYRIYGMDMLDLIAAAGFDVTMHRFSAALNGVFDELYFVARKPLAQGSDGAVSFAQSAMA